MVMCYRCEDYDRYSKEMKQYSDFGGKCKSLLMEKRDNDSCSNSKLAQCPNQKTKESK